MATTYKVLGQSAPSATTDTTLYTVPAATQAVVSTIVIANRAATNDIFRIAIRVAGASIANEDYVAYNVVVGAADSTALTLGITLATTDIITIYASSANMSFNAFGSELT
jgi:glucose-6-phosphate dehydrogenase assembly protein OpcA